MNLTLTDPEFEVLYCLPEGFCNQQVVKDGKTMNWSCEEAMVKYKLAMAVTIVGLISISM
jgi:hypothetical protein